MIMLENIKKTYLKKENKIDVLKGITEDFEEGKFYAVIGKSGVGKSTLIKIMGLIEDATSGKIYIDNNEISNLNDSEKSNIRNKKIGFIFQDYLLDENMTVLENVMLPTIKEKITDSKIEYIYSLLDNYGLSNRINHFPHQLSGGECQRVAICRALVNNPNIILADEPTGNLDKENEIYVFKSLKNESQKGKCVIVVSHSDRVKDYADTLLEIVDGKVSGIKKWNIKQYILKGIS